MTMRRLALAGLIAVAACGTASSPGTPTELTQLPRPLSSAERTVATAGNQFAFSLLSRLAGAQRGENVFVSPVSASMALGMLLNGAAGSTATEMRGALSLGNAPLAEVNQGYHDLMALLRGLDSSVELRVANGVWVDPSIPLQPAFVQAAKQWFDADARVMDFANPATITAINDWVSQQTNGRIRTIMDDATGEEVMALANAVYFKGRWRKTFDAAQTVDAPFRGADGVERQVKLMTAPKDGFSYGEADGAQVAELGYGANAWSMVVVLPREGTGASDFAAGLTPAKWEALLQGLRPGGSVELRLPRFRLEYKRTLNDDLEALGMKQAFVPDGADFTGMSPLGKQLFVTFVTQKTFVEVNEEGTEAAAATGVGIGVTSMPPAMTVNRPFVVAIRERLTGTILFVGVINKLPGT
ncbi:MAG TPA: serpin family protein [Gemmatimonadaceae bacterium]